VVIRTDNTTTGVTYNIADSTMANDDRVTGYPNGNGLSNGVPAFVSAQSVSPSGTLNQQYPNLPQEFHFNYAAVPSNGAAIITVRLNKITTSVYTNRLTTLTRAVNTAAPPQAIGISEPVNDGDTLYLTPNTTYTIQACFTSSLDSTNTNPFSVYVNGALQPRLAGDGSPLYSIGSSDCGYGMNTLSYKWSGALPGTNSIQVVFTNGVVSLGAIRVVTVVNPSFSISGISGGANGQTLIWNSISNLNYQVLATTNLNVPFAPISGVILGNGSSTFFFDSSPDPTSKFYRIQILPY
jgi:hypothetical protein